MTEVPQERSLRARVLLQLCLWAASSFFATLIAHCHLARYFAHDSQLLTASNLSQRGVGVGETKSLRFSGSLLLHISRADREAFARKGQAHRRRRTCHKRLTEKETRPRGPRGLSKKKQDKLKRERERATDAGAQALKKGGLTSFGRVQASTRKSQYTCIQSLGGLNPSFTLLQCSITSGGPMRPGGFDTPLMKSKRNQCSAMRGGSVDPRKALSGMGRGEILH